MICNVKRKLLPRIRCKRVLFNLLYFETSAYQVQISSNSPSQKNTVGPDIFLKIEIFHLIMAIVMTPVLAFLVLLVFNRANSAPCRSKVSTRLKSVSQASARKSTSVRRGLFLLPFFSMFNHFSFILIRSSSKLPGVLLLGHNLYSKHNAFLVHFSELWDASCANYASSARARGPRCGNNNDLLAKTC